MLMARANRIIEHALMGFAVAGVLGIAVTLLTMQTPKASAVSHAIHHLLVGRRSMSRYKNAMWGGRRRVMGSAGGTCSTTSSCCTSPFLQLSGAPS
jgi:hypothetical protein